MLRGSYGINYSRRGAVGGRAGARNGTGTLGFSANASFPSPNGFDPAYNWNNGVPAYPAPPFFDPTLNAGFVTGRGNGGGVTYGDPEIGGRPPRYQNWNAGIPVRADGDSSPVGAAYAGSRGDFLGGSGRGFYANQLDPRYLVLGNLLTQQANAANIAAAQAIVPGVALPYPNFSGTICADAAAVPAVLRRDRRLRQRRAARATTRSSSRIEKRRADDGLTVNVNYTFSRTEDNLAARTGYDFAQDWAVGVNDQPHIFNAIVVYDLPFGAEGQPGSGNGVVRAHRQGLAGLRDHAVPLGPAARRDRGRLQPAERRHVLRGLQPGLHRARSASTATTATATCSGRLRRPTSIATRSCRRRRSPSATRRARSPTICATRATSTRI